MRSASFSASMEAGNGYPANRGSPNWAAEHRQRFNGGREWLPGKRPVWSIGARGCWRLQWRPGMVTRQTRRPSSGHRCHSFASMEAGNGYPANVEAIDWHLFDNGASMEAGNGYPANAAISSFGRTAFHSFNGGREWLPGKPDPSPYHATRHRPLQWRPGMVTRQTGTAEEPAVAPTRFNGGREWLPGKLGVSVVPLLPFHPGFNGGREWLPGKLLFTSGRAIST